MLVSELRVGNWVYWNKEFYQIDIDHLKLYLVFEPIPVTLEILSVIKGVRKSEFTYDLGKLSIHLPSRAYKDGRTYFDSWCIMENSPPYLHQLQNLYYALTQTELEYKPTLFPNSLDEIEPTLSQLMINKQKGQ